MPEFDDFQLGPCCVCGGSEEVRNIIMVHKRSPYGRGWGCVQCGLALEGANIIVCDDCLELYGPKTIHEKAKYFCRPDEDGGYLSGRAPIAELADAPAHEHDMSKHPEETGSAYPA